MGQILVVWLLTFVVGIGRFAHCIATSGEILFGCSRPGCGLGIRALGGCRHAGNILGGVVIVSLLNWGQVHTAKLG